MGYSDAGVAQPFKDVEEDIFFRHHHRENTAQKDGEGQDSEDVGAHFLGHAEVVIICADSRKIN